ncbi:MAG: gamma-glutamylcyclotransferase [Phycisphaerae bacterium]|nr:gamma-glutamylcyclotransferase [Phycisphaerae bacterium]
MPDKKRFNLFVYGTLMDPAVFRAVVGRSIVSDAEHADGQETFWACQAVLNGYKKISPDNTYLYAVPDRGHRIRGYLIRGLPVKLLPALKKYEGRNYSRRTVQVATGDGKEKAYIFVGNQKQLEHAFGWSFRDPMKQEILLARKIDQAVRETEAEQLHTNEQVMRLAVSELSGSKIRDITRRHFEAGGISDYAIRRSIREHPIRDFDRARENPAAKPFLETYLRLVVRQVVFNQFEQKIRREFRYELDHLPSSPVRRTTATDTPIESDIMYERIISSLVALRLLNKNRKVLDVVTADTLGDLDARKDHLVDYVRRAVVAAEAIYEPKAAKGQIIFVRSHMGFGYIPLGAELEFSNIGHDVIRDPQAHNVHDPRYDGFLYFYDFALDELTWKLGGHIDNHHEKAPGRARRGFFEVALGNLSVEANISKPITRDPWVLNQLIHQTMRFYDVRPHSVHVSMQLRSQHKPDRDRLLPLYVMQCLFAIVGDPKADADGNIQLRRLMHGEIVRREPKPSMLFSEISKRYSRQTSDENPAPAGTESEGRYVQQFRFLRLSPDLNYEPIAMALKGIQIRLRPGDFLTPAQYEKSGKHRALFHKLLAWAEAPAPLPEKHVEQFLAHVQEGLLHERRGQPAHSRAYIAWCLNQLQEMLEGFNQRFLPAKPSVKK